MEITAMMRLSRIQILLILATGILSFLIFFFYIQKSSLEAIHPEIGVAIQAAYATGVVEPQIMMPIASKVGGILEKLYVDEGTEIKKGQVLATLQAKDLVHTITQAKARESFAQHELSRMSQLSQSNNVSKEQLEQFKTEYEVAQATREALEAQLEDATLIALTDGLIIKRDGEIGQLIPANQPVFWVSDNSDLRITATVDEEDIPLIQVNQKVLIRADAFEDQVFQGKVSSITPKGDSTQRTYRVRIDILGKTPLMIGMTTESNIIIHESTDALLIPKTALNGHQVQTIENDVLKIKTVQIGAQTFDKVEILKGLTRDSWVVKNFNPDLKEGLKLDYEYTQRNSN